MCVNKTKCADQTKYQDNIINYFDIHINPFDIWENDYVFGYYPDVDYIVCADNFQNALEEFGEYCKKHQLFGYISEGPQNDEDFPVNGGEFYLQPPDAVEKIRNRVQFPYSITYSLYTDESIEEGGTFETGFVSWDNGNLNDNLRDIVKIAEDCNISSCESAGWLYSEYPEEDQDYFEKGEEKFYQLHIKGQNQNNNKILKAIQNEIDPELISQNTPR